MGVRSTFRNPAVVTAGALVPAFVLFASDELAAPDVCTLDGATSAPPLVPWFLPRLSPLGIVSLAGGLGDRIVPIVFDCTFLMPDPLVMLRYG